MKAAALAMGDVPEVNSSWMDTFIRQLAPALTLPKPDVTYPGVHVIMVLKLSARELFDATILCVGH